MRSASIREELEAITSSYDYGIVPGSATAFHLDEAMGFGRVDLTLLEGVMVIIEVNQQGYKVVSQSALFCGPAAEQATKTIEGYMDHPFETVENLLMSISPLFAERFRQVLCQKLDNINNQSAPSSTPAQTEDLTASTTFHNFDPVLPPSSSPAQPPPPQQQQELYPTSHSFLHQPPTMFE
ncbi:hypothetical protein RO3G_08928 [Lichtheimia corymbifera JMRC:FSU:9682]|uniref:GSKIP domain-containing protein n=1 Tax=Lichtheimia corymbifera JMRC:FSU:9682 TaxID=1263082 RepID=A0A068RW35_9FUNG|nr:hypothetical protein RO3G_08928 [Lichtheimia corymbifera JMRC:FSU:9682]